MAVDSLRDLVGAAVLGARVGRRRGRRRRVAQVEDIVAPFTRARGRGKKYVKDHTRVTATDGK